MQTYWNIQAYMRVVQEFSNYSQAHLTRRNELVAFWKVFFFQKKQFPPLNVGGTHDEDAKMAGKMQKFRQ